MLNFLSESEQKLLNELINFNEETTTFEELKNGVDSLEYSFSMCWLGRKDKVYDKNWNLLRKLSEANIPKSELTGDIFPLYQDAVYNDINKNAHNSKLFWQYIKSYLVQSYELNYFNQPTSNSFFFIDFFKDLFKK